MEKPFLYLDHGQPDVQIARRDRHHEYAQHIWWEWTKADAARNVNTLIQDIMRTALDRGTG